MRLILATLFLTPALLAQAPKCPPPVGHIDIADGTYSSSPGIVFHLRRFDATLIPQGKTAPFCYGKTTVVSRAEIFVSNESLTKVFTEKLTQSDSKIKDFKVTNGMDNVTLSGKIVKIIPLDFSISGSVSTDGTALLLKADKIKADGIPIKALLEIVGKHLSSVLGMKDVSGVAVQDNTIIFYPEKIAHLKGHISSVQSNNDGLILRYGPTPRGARRTPLPTP